MRRAVVDTVLSLYTLKKDNNKNKANKYAVYSKIPNFTNAGYFEKNVNVIKAS